MPQVGQFQPIGLHATSNPGRLKQTGNARLINVVPEKAGAEGKALMPLYGREGLRRFATMSAAPGGVRGTLEIDAGAALVVAGHHLYRVSSTGASVQLGNIRGSGKAYLARNRRGGPEVVIVADGRAYVLAGTVLSPLQVPAPDTGFTVPLDVTFIDGYLVMAARNGEFHFTGIDSATDITALNYAKAEGNPDGLLRCINKRRELWLFGDRSIEVWGVTGDITTPFRRLGGGFLDVGILAPHSLQNLEEKLIWIAHDTTVRVAEQGYTAMPISTPAVSRSIANDANPADIRGMTYTLNDHKHYLISGTDWTWGFDFSTGGWLERDSYGMGRWRGEDAFRFGTKVICGDKDWPRLYEISEGAKTDDDLPIVKTVIFPTVYAFPRAVSFFDFRVDLVPGLGAPSLGNPAADINPEVTLFWSDDGSVTWSGGRKKSLGAIGDSTRMVRFDQLGQCRGQGRQFKLVVSAAVDLAITGCGVTAAGVSNP